MVAKQFHDNGKESIDKFIVSLYVIYTSFYRTTFLLKRNITLTADIEDDNKDA